MTEAKPRTPGLRFKDKVVIVTGGSKGIGEGCVQVFVRSGAKAVFCDIDVEKGKMLEEEINKNGDPGEAFFVPCDVTKEEQVKTLIAKTVERYGKIDCLINNAGIHPPPVTIDDITGDDFRNLFEVNVMGYFFMSKYALPHLRKTKGSIINNASLVGQLGQEAAVSYVSTKGAVSAMTRALAIDEAVNNVRVNTVSPSNVWTPLWNSMAQSLPDSAKFIRDGAENQVLGRFGTIMEVGELCLFLAAEGSFITGIDVPVSGGAELGYGGKSRLSEPMMPL